MKSSVSGLLLLPLLGAATPTLNFLPAGTGYQSSGSAGPDPSLITIASASFSGNGCPQGTVSTSISSDKTIITFGFDAFQTYIGPGTSTPQSSYPPPSSCYVLTRRSAVADRSKNCQLHLTLNYPGGFQYAVLDSTYHGYAQMDAGVTSSFLSTYYFSQDASATTTTKTSLTGGGIWAAGQVYTKQVSPLKSRPGAKWLFFSSSSLLRRFNLEQLRTLFPLPASSTVHAARRASSTSTTALR